MRIDEEEVVITRYNGASNKNQRYYRHKDSYIHDENNKTHGKSMRKITVVVFLNDEKNIKKASKA